MKTLICTILAGVFVLLLFGGCTDPKVALPEKTSVAAEETRHTVLYYLHRTIRCHECLAMEKMTGELMKTVFKDALGSGRLEYVIGNLDEPEYEPYFDLFDLSFSTLVLVDSDGAGSMTQWKKLDDAWSKADDNAAFNTYVTREINAWLDAAESNR